MQLATTTNAQTSVQ